jgi:hypothetical protein
MLLRCHKGASHSAMARWRSFPRGLQSDLTEVVEGEIRAGDFHVDAFAADLNHADHAIAGENRGANDFLDDLGVFRGEFNAFEDVGVFDGGEIVDDFGGLSRVVQRRARICWKEG